MRRKSAVEWRGHRQRTRHEIPAAAGPDRVERDRLAVGAPARASHARALEARQLSLLGSVAIRHPQFAVARPARGEYDPRAIRREPISMSSTSTRYAKGFVPCGLAIRQSRYPQFPDVHVEARGLIDYAGTGRATEGLSCPDVRQHELGRPAADGDSPQPRSIRARVKDDAAAVLAQSSASLMAECPLNRFPRWPQLVERLQKDVPPKAGPGSANERQISAVWRNNRLNVAEIRGGWVNCRFRLSSRENK